MGIVGCGIGCVSCATTSAVGTALAANQAVAAAPVVASAVGSAASNTASAVGSATAAVANTTGSAVNSVVPLPFAGPSRPPIIVDTQAALVVVNGKNTVVVLKRQPDQY